MPKTKSTILAANINTRQAATSLIEVPPEFFNICAKMKVLTGRTITPEAVIQEFIDGVCHQYTPGWPATDQEADRADRAISIRDYLTCFYGSRRSAVRRRLDAARKAAEGRTN